MISFHYDNYGLIVQANGDGGDTAAREGAFWIAGVLYNEPSVDEFNRTIKLLEPEPGIFIRNPKKNPVVPPAKSWNDPTDFSRDQTIPVIIALGFMRKFDSLKSLLVNQFKRFGLFQNDDLPDGTTVGAYIRAFEAHYFYPALFVTDLDLVIESVIRCFEGDDPDNTSDDINHTLALLQAQNVMPTPISYLARKIYTHFRSQGGVQGAWDRYFAPSTGANPFNELFRELIGKM